MAHVLFNHVAATHPPVYQQILDTIRPHSLEAIVRHFQSHLEASCPDLRVFNRHPDQVPDLLLKFARAVVKQFPAPGDAFGIHLTCRITKKDTQGTLDSKHLPASTHQSHLHHLQIFEMNTHKKVLWTQHTTSELVERLPEAGVWTPQCPPHKALDAEGRYKYTSTFPYVVVGQQVVYTKQLPVLLRRLTRVEAFSDLRTVFQKCGLVSYFFNVARLNPERDVMTVVKVQCRTGRPLPLTREGLAKNPERSPMEVLSFEAPKKNLARLCTLKKGFYPVEKSSDKMFFGQQFNEGTGFFALRGKEK